MRQEITLTLILLVIIITAIVLGQSIYVYGPQTSVSQDLIPGKGTVWVYNGSMRSQLAERVTNMLRLHGFDSYNKGNAQMQTYNKTLVISRNGNNMKLAQEVALYLGVDNPFFLFSDVETTNDITVILGDSYREIE